MDAHQGAPQQRLYLNAAVQPMPLIRNATRHQSIRPMRAELSLYFARCLKSVGLKCEDVLTHDDCYFTRSVTAVDPLDDNSLTVNNIFVRFSHCFDTLDTISSKIYPGNRLHFSSTKVSLGEVPRRSKRN